MTGLVSSSVESLVSSANFRPRGALGGGAFGVKNVGCALCKASAKSVLSLKPELSPVELAKRSGEKPELSIGVPLSDLRRFAKLGVVPNSADGRFRTRASMSSERGDSTQRRAKVVEFGSESLIKFTFWRTTSRSRSLNVTLKI